MGTSYHPQSDGQTEVVNHCLETYFRCFTLEQPKVWSKFLAWAEYSYNTGYHSSANMSPFKIVYGRDPPLLHHFIPGEKKIVDLQQQLIARDNMLQVLPANLQKDQSLMKSLADTKRRDMSYEVGDMVLLRLQPYK